jgi:FtsH-binding integral membrane protein
MNEKAYNNPYVAVADAGASERSRFIRRTYLHLAGALLAFTTLEAVFLSSPVAPALINLMVGSQYSWLIVLGLFMGVSWLAESWARSGVSVAMQYAGLALYVVAQAVIFIPLLYVAAFYSSPEIIPMAAMITGGLFLLVIGGFVALGFIVASILFGFNLGTFFAGAMVVFASIAILYSTSAIFRDYRTDQYVAASLTLFASVALLFWYILRILLSFRR